MDKISREILRTNHAGAFIRKDAKPTDKATNYGVIRIENEETLVYWTYKAMHMMNYVFGSKLKLDELQSKGEKYLIENGYVGTVALKDIRVLF